MVATTSEKKDATKKEKKKPKAAAQAAAAESESPEAPGELMPSHQSTCTKLIFRTDRPNGNISGGDVKGEAKARQEGEEI